MKNQDCDLRWTFDVETGEEQGPGDALGQNFKQKPYASLLREAIQNSLDVPINRDMPVIVSFSFGKLREKSYAGFFAIKDHIQGCIDYWNKKPQIVNKYQAMLDCFTHQYNSEISYLKISDRNTTGMNYIENDNNNPFYAFVRASKVSIKPGENSGGSYGFGKAAYFQLSPLNTLLISTMTIDKKCFFEGKSVLCTHLYNGERKTSVGYYDDTSGKKPVSDFSRIPARFIREEPGTDFYIMGFLPSKIDEAIYEMIEETLRSFFVAILKNRLIVEIIDEHSVVREISSKNIIELLNEFFPQESDISAQFRTLNPRPYFDAIANTADSRKFFKFYKDDEVLGKIQLHVKKEKGASDKIVFLREPLMAISAKKTSSSLGFYGVFICEDLKGDKLLKELENSSHTEWNTANWRDPITLDINPLAKKAMNAVKSFYEDCIARMIGNNNSPELSLAGLDELLYIPDSLIEEPETDEETVVGNPSRDVKDEGVSMTTDINKGEFAKSEYSGLYNNGIIVQNSLGGVDIIGDGDSVIGVEQSGKRHSGKGNIKPGVDERKGKYMDDDTCVPHEYKVRCRVFAQKENNQWWHYITIHTETPITDGLMSIMVCGENKDVAVTIVETDKWKCRNNQIFGINMPIGTTRFKIRFADNMKYTLRTDIYHE